MNNYIIFGIAALIGLMLLGPVGLVIGLLVAALITK